MEFLVWLPLSGSVIEQTGKTRLRGDPADPTTFPDPTEFGYSVVSKVKISAIEFDSDRGQVLVKVITEDAGFRDHLINDENLELEWDVALGMPDRIPAQNQTSMIARMNARRSGKGFPNLPAFRDRRSE